MKIACWNVNGIRACIKKGFWDWFEQTDADIVCLQETKIIQKDFLPIAKEHNLISLINPEPELDLSRETITDNRKPIYYALATAQKAGYSGVLLLSKTKPHSVQIGLGKDDFDSEGRIIIATYPKFTLVTTYVPNGGRDLDRIPYKLAFSDYLLKTLEKIRKTQKNIIVCGDMNVAHTEIDIKNPKTNVNNSGFTPVERDWFTKFLSHKYKDAFRALYPDARDVYTWWSYRPGVRQKNIGWRIDYFVVTQEMMKNVKDVTVQADQLGSDHCPIELVFSTYY